MRTLSLSFFLAFLATCAFPQQSSSPAPDTRQQGVTTRGDHVMGFSHELTTYHFRLLKDGGEIIVQANDPSDKASVEQIRIHLAISMHPCSFTTQVLPAPPP